MPVGQRLYPVSLVVAGRRCVVVGGGQVALRKVSALVEAGASVVVVAPEICEEIMAMGVEVVGRRYEASDISSAWLVIAATDDPTVNRKVYADGGAVGVWVNSADDPEACAFTLPAVARQGPVTVAVSTGGHSPALAGWIRDQVAGCLGPEIGVLAEMLSAAREQIQQSGRSTEGLDWRKVLDSGMLELIREGQTAQARERLEACLY